VRASCFLKKIDIPSHVGLRHRAAIGITEESDALTIVVSEQRGEISVAESGNLMVNIKVQKLKKS